MKQLNAHIAETIRRGRTDLGLTQAEASVRLRVDESLVFLAETNPSKMPMRELAKLVQGYGVANEVIHQLCCSVRMGSPPQ